jgi:hypothetical protein
MISGTVKNTEKVLVRLDGIAPNIKAALKEEVQRQVINLQNYVKANKLGGQVLKRKTGTLSRSIQQNVTETASGVSGFVDSRINESSPLKYAAVHEYGFNGSVTVREHLRMMTQAFGHPVKEPHKITIRTFNRNMNMPERSYLRSSLGELQQQITDAINAAVDRGAKK